MSRLRLYDCRLTGFADEAAHILLAAEILYFESVDERTFFYTAESVFETSMKLYEIEDNHLNQQLNSYKAK